MAAGTGIRDFVLIRHFRGDESKRMAADIDARNRLLDLRHVASHAIVSRRPSFMMGVFLNRGGMRSIRSFRAVALQT